ncbi:hypothetical protein [Metabacillus sp. FJAT-53654]|uniref:AraC-type arabinose-binding/dimerisation domain-containing protein n=1 Tax=Metabacillus rhizosphaerae TaxID=3117747 RepID=A0ABZ2MXH6_9BACI
MQYNNQKDKNEENWNRYYYQLSDINRLKSREVPFRLSHCFELLIVIEGEGTINLGLEAFQLHADEACVVHPMQSYNIKTKHGESLEYFIC